MSTQAGQNLVERSLVNIFATTLGRTDVALTDNFFETGGGSLLAMVTIEQINQRLGWSLNMGDLIAHPSAGELAANKALRQAANTERVMLRLSNRGTKTPIVLVHPGLGIIASYARLVGELGQDRGCYAIQSPIFTDTADRTGLDTVEGTAQRYLNLIEDEFGDDEFHLLGACGGGSIALEIARLAGEHGFGLRKLVILDSYIFHDPPADMNEDHVLGEFRAGVLELVSVDVWDEVNSRIETDREAVFRELSAALFGADGQDEAGARFMARLYEAFRANYLALKEYRPKPVAADALVLHSAQNYTLDTWREVIQGEQVIKQIDPETYGFPWDVEAAWVAAQIEAFVGEG